MKSEVTLIGMIGLCSTLILASICFSSKTEAAGSAVVSHLPAVFDGKYDARIVRLPGGTSGKFGMAIIVRNTITGATVYESSPSNDYSISPESFQCVDLDEDGICEILSLYTIEGEIGASVLKVIYQSGSIIGSRDIEDIMEFTVSNLDDGKQKKIVVTRALPQDAQGVVDLGVDPVYPVEVYYYKSGRIERIKGGILKFWKARYRLVESHILLAEDWVLWVTSYLNVMQKERELICNQSPSICQ